MDSAHGLLERMGTAAQLPAAALAAVRKYDSTVETVQRETRWTKEAKAEALAEARGQLATTLDAVETATLKDVTRSLEQETARKRNELRGQTTPITESESDAARHARAVRLMQEHATTTRTATDVALIGVAAEAGDVEGIGDLLAEAIDTESPYVVDRMWRAARPRLMHLAKLKDQTVADAARVAFTAWTGRIADFRKAHPTVREQIDALEREQRGRLTLARQPFIQARQAIGLMTQPERDTRRVQDAAMV